MKVAVKDACVLIDLANGGLLEAWFQLGVETFTTDLVIRQVKGEHQWEAVSAFVQAGLLRIETLTGAQVERMTQTLGGLAIGVEDQSVLFLAIERSAVLVTGDRRLRIEADKWKVEVRGLLWILDELVARAAIAPTIAAAKLQSYARTWGPPSRRRVSGAASGVDSTPRGRMTGKKRRRATGWSVCGSGCINQKRRSAFSFRSLLSIQIFFPAAVAPLRQLQSPSTLQAIGSGRRR